jgi:hypothetical protein
MMGTNLYGVELASFAAAFPTAPRKYLESAAQHSRQAIHSTLDMDDPNFNWEQIDEQGRRVARLLDEGAKRGHLSADFEGALKGEASTSPPKAPLEAGWAHKSSEAEWGQAEA